MKLIVEDQVPVLTYVKDVPEGAFFTRIRSAVDPSIFMKYCLNTGNIEPAKRLGGEIAQIINMSTRTIAYLDPKERVRILVPPEKIVFKYKEY